MLQKLTEDQVKGLITKPHAGHPGVTNPTMQNVLKTCIENTQKLYEDQAMSTSTGNMSQFTPVVISLLRRTLPSLIGPDIIGTQALKVPTGRIFVERVYGINDPTKGNAKTEVWGYTVGSDKKTTGRMTPDPRLSAGDAEWATTDFADTLSADGKTVETVGAYNTALGKVDGTDEKWPSWEKNFTTADGENLAYPTQTGNATTAWPEMTFGIDFIDVNVHTRALKGRISTEVMEDLKAVHNVDAESELSNILESEITAEIDREIIGRVYYEAETGAQNCATTGTFSFKNDTNGRWTAEKVLDLMIQIEREATAIAQRTRRGRGNFIITSPELASILSMNNLLTPIVQDSKFTPVVNPLGTSMIGTLAGRFKVYIDPYMSATSNKHVVVVGYKGTSEADAGLIYCPYVPIQMYTQVGEEDFGKRIGIKSRYGLVSNPWMCQMKADTDENGRQYSTRALPGTNMYYRKFIVDLDTTNQSAATGA